MSGERGGGFTATATWLALALSAALVVADVVSKFAGGAADTQITAGQVNMLTSQVRELSSSMKELTAQIAVMPTSREVSGLSLRLDKTETSIGELRDTATRLRADVDNLMHPTNFRQPR